MAGSKEGWGGEWCHGDKMKNGLVAEPVAKGKKAKNDSTFRQGGQQA